MTTHPVAEGRGGGNADFVMSVPATLAARSIPIPAQSESVALVHIIERAARDPSVDIDKLSKLIALRNEIRTQDAQAAFARAMALAQADMRPIAADAQNPQTHSRYASHAALDRSLRPIYSQHGFSLSFDTGEGAPEMFVRVLCHVENSGHCRTYHIDMPADGKGARGNDVMTRTHATGSAITYGRRYLLQMIFNIAIGPDDDGNAAAGNGHAPHAPNGLAAEQIEQLRSLIIETNTDLPRFYKHFRIERLEAMRLADYQRAIGMLKAKQAKETR